MPERGIHAILRHDMFSVMKTMPVVGKSPSCIKIVDDELLEGDE